MKIIKAVLMNDRIEKPVNVNIPVWVANDGSLLHSLMAILLGSTVSLLLNISIDQYKLLKSKPLYFYWWIKASNAVSLPCTQEPAYHHSSFKA